ncbi:MAG TPA: YbgC/FadM family acyl-CoA thioesterase [Gammaproteobacteria bacterium]|nr:YbgC/FadM family acyl-CoA thioesterase [Gammaproteobacteria bacterium]
MLAYCWPVRVYYEDTDHGGVVYYANYLKFMERCRTEFLRARGFEQNQLIEQHDLIFAVRRVEVDYLTFATFNEQLLVTALVKQASKVRMLFEQKIYRISHAAAYLSGGFVDTEAVEAEAPLLCQAKISVVSLSASRFRPQRMPNIFFEELMCEC